LDFEPRQGGIEHRLLPAMQLLARPPPEKGARLSRTGLGQLVIWFGHGGLCVARSHIPPHRSRDSGNPRDDFSVSGAGQDYFTAALSALTRPVFSHEKLP